MAPYRGLLHHFHRRLAGEALSHLGGILGDWIPQRQLDRLRQCGRRRRVFTPMATFWSFLAQVLSPAQPCRETVRTVQGARQQRRQSAICSGTGAYCQARRRLPEGILQAIWRGIAEQLSDAASPQMLWRGWRVGVVDGTTLSMPDTAANQAVWPQHRGQKPGCGFPVMKLLGLFSLATGAVQGLVIGSLHNAEHALFPHLWDTLTRGFDLLLGDRNFGSFAVFGSLRCCGLHGVFRMHQRRKIDWRKGKRLGKFDRVFLWNKPRKLSWWLPHPIPDSIEIRVVKVCVPIAGFRTRVLLIATDLLDPEQFPPPALADLYRRRWQVELFFRHIKTTMHMDVLRCKSPAMIERELHMHMIAYNLVRALMLQAALTYATPLCRISFKGSCDTLRQWAPHLALATATPGSYHRLFRSMLKILANDTVPLRPDRSEPRAVKRRPKNYRRLMKPRHLVGNLPHRNRPK
jgi:DDE family transposase